jgi:hypothetical protein
MLDPNSVQIMNITSQTVVDGELANKLMEYVSRDITSSQLYEIEEYERNKHLDYNSRKIEEALKNENNHNESIDGTLEQLHHQGINNK